jgi:hypothetical protein
VNPQRISFARTLPILAPLLSYLVVAVLSTMVYVNLKLASRHGHDVILHTHQFRLRVPHDDVLSSSVLLVARGSSRTIRAINLPAHFIEFAFAKATRTSSTTWSPFHWDFLVWRAFGFPILCLPFWWLAGVGLDGMVGTRRFHWWSLLPALLLWSFFLFALAAFYVAFSPLERTEVVYPVWSVWLWLTLFSTFPIAWIKQALAHRRIKNTLQARLSAELQ